MRKLSFLVLLAGMCALSGCSSIEARTIGYRKGGVSGPPFFSGVSLDYIQVFDRDSIEPNRRTHPGWAIADAPFSLVGDILFLPYDMCVGPGPADRY
jgi:uncharacterized protein YceK